MSDDCPIFSTDDDAWYFYDETGTQFYGPFQSKVSVELAQHDYETYLSTGLYPEWLTGDGRSWHDAEAVSPIEVIYAS